MCKIALPDSFRSSMRELIPEDYEAFEKTYEDRPYFALRINTAKISESEFEKIAPYPAKKIPFTEGGYYISDTDAWSKHPYYTGTVGDASR